MISLVGRRPQQPEDLDATCRDAKEAVQAIIDAKGVPKSANFESAWTPFRSLLAEAQYDGKCAFCETRIRGGSSGDVEHFRPKAAVTEYGDRGNRNDLTGAPPRRTKTAEFKPGYWWLAYAWSNWVYSCSRCNTWKDNQFPLAGRKRRGSPERGAEKNERSLLLNPFDVDPEPHFTWTELGQIRGATLKGRKTVDVCGLDRKTLDVERGRVAQTILELSEDYELALAEKAELAQTQSLSRALDMCNPAAPYSGMARWLVARHFEISYPELLALRQHGII